MNAAPLFLVGSPRSGTTLLRLMVSSHPEIVIAPESSFLTWLEPHFADWTEGDSVSPRKEEFVQALMAARKFETWEIDGATIATRIEEARPATYAELATIPYVLYAEAVGKSAAVWGDKNNVHLLHIPVLRTLFPSAGFIHIIRDVRDCFASAHDIATSDISSPYKPMLTMDAAEFGREWNDANQKALTDLRAANNPWATVRYEDLTTDPRGTLEPVFHHLGFEWDDAVLDFHSINRERGMEPAATMAWKKLTTEPVTDRRIGRFREVLDGDAIRALEVSAHHTLTEFGYPGL